MKNKRIFSILALALCLPILALVAVGCDLFGKKPESLEIDTSEAKVLYYEGEDFSSEGLVVTAKYKDGSAEEVEDFEVDSSRFDKDEAGEYIIFVSYKGITDGYIVTVKEDVVEDLEVSVENKFFVGQEFKTNAVVTATYTSGKTENVENYSVTSFDKTAVGTQTALIAFGGEEASVDVEVLSNVDYVAWVKGKLRANILTFDEANYSSTLTHDINNFLMTMNEGDIELNAVNNGSVWHCKMGEDGEFGELWIDMISKVVYTKLGDICSKQTYPTKKALLQSDNSSMFEACHVDMVYSYAYMMNQEGFIGEVGSISIVDGVLVLEDNSGKCYIDMEKWLCKKREAQDEDFSVTYQYNLLESEIEVPAIPNENWIVDFDVELVNEKMFIGQEINTNLKVSVTYEDETTAVVSDFEISYNETEDWMVGEPYEIQITVGRIIKSIEIEVVSDEDYIDYVTTKLQAGVLSVDNVNYTATLAFPVVEGCVCADEDIVVGNDGSIWCLLPEEVGGSMAFDAFWYDIDSNVLYVKIGDVYTQKSFDSYLAGATYLYETYFSGMGGLNFELFVSLYFYNPQCSYAYFVSSVSSTTLTGSTITMEDGVLTLSQGTEGACIKIDYEKWMLTEIISIVGEGQPAQITKFGSVNEIEIPAIPDVEWVEV